MTRLQVVLSVAPDVPLVLGMPPALRTAHALLGDGIARVFIVTDAAPELSRAWGKQLRRLPWAPVPSWPSLGTALDPTAPVLLLEPSGMPDARDLRTFLAECRDRAVPTAWIWNGRTVAIYAPAAGDVVARLCSRGRHSSPSVFAHVPGDRVVADASSWYGLDNSKELERAERDLLRSLRKDTDGYLARLDRRISIALSRAAIGTPITPNAITAASLLLGLVGAALLATPAYAAALGGAVILWTTCVLDGCDGEVARLKLLSSPTGARFDVIADNIVHVAVFVALTVHVSLSRADVHAVAGGLVLLAGVLLSMAAVWWLLLRRPSPHPGALELFYERVASRDFIYVIVALAAIQRLDWFLWAAAVGSHVFWVTLCALASRRR